MVKIVDQCQEDKYPKHEDQGKPCIFFNGIHLILNISVSPIIPTR